MKDMLVSCDKHGKNLLGYACCLHIGTGAKIASFEKATNSMIGSAVCAECQKRELTVDDCVLICAGCLSEIAGEISSHIQ